MTDRGTNTLAARGLEELFSSCAVVSVLWFWWEIALGLLANLKETRKVKRAYRVEATSIKSVVTE
jgi:hypothetical protein